MAINAVFERLNQRYVEGNLTFEEMQRELEAPANEYFDAHRTPTDHNALFVMFTPIWMTLIQNRAYFDGIRLWNFAINLAVNWENNNKPNKIHKGTPFYFLGVTGILNNELENGFLTMHQAMEEDKRLSGRRLPEAPAFWFVTLDNRHRDQFFVQKVEQITNYLTEKLIAYTDNRGGNLTLDQLRAHFLRHSRLREEVFLFVYCIFRLRKLDIETSKIYKKNTFSSIMHADLLFDFSVIVDKVMEYKNPIRRTQRLTFADELIFLSVAPRRLLSFNVGDKIRILKDDFQADFSGTLSRLFKRRYALALTDIERDFAITYGIRNFGAHKIENQPSLYNNLAKIAQSELNALFCTIEKTY
jgi:hypothetical protein